MTAPLFALLVAAGGLGAAARFVLDGVVRARTSGRFPIATALINTSGSFLLGLLTGLALAGATPDAVRLVAGAGFLGGYTTFSTASFETVRLAQQGRLGASLANGVGLLVVCVVLAAAGVALGRAA